MRVVSDDIHGSVGLVPVSCLTEIRLSWYIAVLLKNQGQVHIEYYG